MSCTTLFKRHHYPQPSKGKKICLRCGYDSTCPKCTVEMTNGVCPNDQHPTHLNWGKTASGEQSTTENIVQEVNDNGADVAE